MSRDVASFIESGAELVDTLAAAILNAAQLSVACEVLGAVVIHFTPTAMGVAVVAADGEEVGAIDGAVITALKIIQLSKSNIFSLTWLAQITITIEAVVMSRDVAHLVIAGTLFVLAVAAGLLATVAPAAGVTGAGLGALAVLHTLR
jgi:hypothetical protein